MRTPSGRPGRRTRHRAIAALLTFALLSSGTATAAAEPPYGPHPDMPELWTVAHGPFCAGWVHPMAIVNRDTFPGQTKIYLYGHFVGLSWNPPRLCWSTVTVSWRNLDTGARGEFRERVEGLISPSPGVPADRTLDTGRGRIRFEVSTDLPHLPVSHEVVAL